MQQRVGRGLNVQLIYKHTNNNGWNNLTVIECILISQISTETQDELLV